MEKITWFILSWLFYALIGLFATAFSDYTMIGLVHDVMYGVPTTALIWGIAEVVWTYKKMLDETNE